MILLQAMTSTEYPHDHMDVEGEEMAYNEANRYRTHLVLSRQGSSIHAPSAALPETFYDGQGGSCTCAPVSALHSRDRAI